jgi:hypothetical protein
MLAGAELLKHPTRLYTPQGALEIDTLEKSEELFIHVDKVSVHNQFDVGIMESTFPQATKESKAMFNQSFVKMF